MENKCRAYMDDKDGEDPIFRCTSNHASHCRFGCVINMSLSGCKHWDDMKCGNIAAKVDAVTGSIVVFRRWMQKNRKGSDL